MKTLIHDRRRGFDWALPFVARWLKRPFCIILMLGIVATVLSTISWHFAIAVAAFGCFYWCLSIERRHLDHLILPPLVVLGVNHLLSSGLGLPLIWLGISSYGNLYEDELQAVGLAQVAHAIAFPILIVGYKLGRAGSPSFSLGQNANEQNSTLRILSRIGWLLLLYYVIEAAGAVATGSNDRSRILEFLDRGFGIWSWFQLFPRFTAIFFLLAPLMFSRAGKLCRIVLAALICVKIGFGIVSGCRGALLLPICFLFAGWWMFFPHSRRILRFAVLIAALMAPYIVFVPFYRSTENFTNTQQTNLLGRIGAISSGLALLGGQEIGGVVQLAGEGLHGVNDRQVFSKTPNEIAHAGWENFDRLKTFWLPSLIAPEKKSLFDGNEIVQAYLPESYIFGATISFTADMFRRFGWMGVVMGSLVIGVFHGRIYRFAFRMQRGPYRLYATLFVLYGISYLTSTPYMTMLETCWMWMWELPKHLLVLLLITTLVSVPSRQSRSERIANDQPKRGSLQPKHA